jgi:predicted small secreted protein
MVRTALVIALLAAAAALPAAAQTGGRGTAGSPQ